MPNSLNVPRTALLAVVAGAVALAALSTMTGAQTPAQGIQRFADGHANLSGIWQANNTANWDSSRTRRGRGR